MFDHAPVLHVDGHPTACRVATARSFAQRARGLLWRAPLQSQQGLWITRCASIHTVGMAYAIDVAFLDEEGRVLRVCAHVAPWRFRWRLGASEVLELRAGQARALGIEAGCRIARHNPDMPPHSTSRAH
ncbi:Uncharacterized ACR, COG1430 [Delftia tsuruhatensis]|uniref:DUF192 domain-containing protein n=1 Tax=Delftia tsuruhatensis TaxID=180282 RepID=UPI001E791329|nr:DUF192 domain-containing protein [Delftia tsuruhatensis]CAB5691634.1 Uncharacterized ACR, COG1430 [Delftia tsuruhatensis]CAC9676860.1 Uncharacterized ACR, COG1430 [Delftia tsuruhatensis]